jgi:hypothetical protein
MLCLKQLRTCVALRCRPAERLALLARPTSIRLLPVAPPQLLQLCSKHFFRFWLSRSGDSVRGRVAVHKQQRATRKKRTPSAQNMRTWWGRNGATCDHAN